MRLRAFHLPLLGLLVGACGQHGGADTTGSSTPASASPSGAGGVVAASSREMALLQAELRRQADGVLPADLADRRVRVRRAAARALARIRGDVVRARLLRLLSDEDEQVVAWAAYGLGQSCGGDRGTIVNALVVAAMARASLEPGTAPAGPLSTGAAITRAIGRCAAVPAERVLAAWVRRRGPLFRHAIEALGDVAGRHRKLREETIATLLDAAAGSAAKLPAPEALYPLGRLEHLPPSVLARTFEVAKARLAAKGAERRHAVRALGRCADSAVPVLAQVAGDEDGYTPRERIAAVRQLARFSGQGQRALQRLIGTLVPDTSAVAATSLVGPALGVTLEALHGMDAVGRARPTLRKLAALAPPPDAPAAVARRLSLLRCAAAGLLAEREYLSPVLRACDLSVPKDKRATEPLMAPLGARTVVAAIGVDGVKVRGKRLQAWRAYALGGPVVARELAISQLAGHDEIGQAAAVLTEAIGAEQPGVVAAAAAVLAKHPARARARGGPKRKRGKKKGRAPATAGPPAALVEALLAALDGPKAVTDVEARALLVDAAAALGLKAAEPTLRKLCGGPYVVERERATKALLKLGGKAGTIKCGVPHPMPLPAELGHLVTHVVQLSLDSDVGRLTLRLDPSLAPVAVTRVVDLAAKGYYDGAVVHRVVPGFVSQLGSPTADGYGGAPDAPPLACETSPVGFGPLSVGVALAGRDTGSSQIFVTHAAAPHLDGEYSYLGVAIGGWDALVEGDVITRARVKQ